MARFSLPNTMLISAKNISHKYDYPLFENVNFSINEKESISIVGVSGCGKSTLLHICSSLLSPNKGEVLYNNLSLYKQKNQTLLDIRRYEMGIIFQSHYLFKGFSAKENVQLSNILSRQNFDEEVLQKLNVLHVINQNIGNLSGGQQQRISIARVLSKKPKIIFADEPTGNLDNKTANEVMDILFDYIQKNNACLMLVTHDLNLAKKCNRTYELKNLVLEQI